MNSACPLQTYYPCRKYKPVRYRTPLVYRLTRYLFRQSHGQAVVETTFMLATTALILIIAVEGANVLKRAYAVNQLAYQGARYAAVNPGYDPTTITNYMLQIVPSDIDSAQLNIAISPDVTPRAPGTAVTVQVTYAFAHPVRLGPTLFGLNFPSTVVGSDTTMTQ